MSSRTSAPLVFVLRNERRGQNSVVSVREGDTYARTIGAAMHICTDALAPAAVDITFSNIATWLDKNRAAFERDAYVREQRTATCVVSKTSWESSSYTTDENVLLSQKNNNKLHKSGCCM